MADEPLQESDGIVAECGDDRTTAVFSTAFSDTDPFDEALWVARLIGEKDVESRPGSASPRGKIIVGYLGTPLNHNCAAVGRPVELAGVCAGFEPPAGPGGGWRVRHPPAGPR
ncbi:MAG: hypothetical protein QM729_07210 [Solirubrobacterales bacterium]